MYTFPKRNNILISQYPGKDGREGCERICVHCVLTVFSLFFFSLSLWMSLYVSHLSLSLSLCVCVCVCVALRPPMVVMAMVVIADEDMSDASDGEGYRAAESN